jgi:hypothetical protein
VVKKLAVDAMRADAAAVAGLLEGRTTESDPIGYTQLSRRLELLGQKIAHLNEQAELKASVALFFAGSPVVGSRGIKVDFAGRAIELFQDLVAKQFACEEVGEIGRRGPVPMRASSDLLLTHIARGSIGFVLEEADLNDVITETQLKIVVDHVTDAIFATSATSSADFDQLLEDIDHRYLTTLSELFTLLDDQDATVRIVEGERDIQLDGPSIKRARERTTNAQISERETEEFSGRLFLLPAHRKFELVRFDGGGTVYGTVSSDFARGQLGGLLSDGGVVGQNWRVKMRVRTLLRPNREPKLTYMLLGLIEQLSAD